MSDLLLTQSPGDKVQTETGKVDPARKFKCTTAARVQSRILDWSENVASSYIYNIKRMQNLSHHGY